MDKKLITIVGIVISLVFVASFLILWNTGKSTMSLAVNEYSKSRQMPYSNWNYDWTLLEGKKISKDTKSRLNTLMSNGTAPFNVSTDTTTSSGKYVKITISGQNEIKLENGT